MSQSLRLHSPPSDRNINPIFSTVTRHFNLHNDVFMGDKDLKVTIHSILKNVA